jgi:hypothetical protein
MADKNKHDYPLTNGSLLNDSKNARWAGGDAMFVLAKTDEFTLSSGAKHFSVDAAENLPVAVNDKKLREQIFKDTGSWLPTRAEVAKGTVDWDKVKATNPELADVATADLKKLKLLGSNMLQEIKVGNEPSQTAIFYREDKKAHAIPGGVVADKDMRETAQREVNGETPVITFNPKTKELQLNLVYPEGATTSQKAEFFSEAVSKVGTIRERFDAQTHGEYKDTPMKITGIEAKALPAENAPTVRVNVAGEQHIYRAAAVVNDKDHSFGIVQHREIAFLKDVKVFTVDPQPYNNPMKIVDTQKLGEHKGTDPLKVAVDVFVAPLSTPKTTQQSGVIER